MKTILVVLSFVLVLAQPSQAQFRKGQIDAEKIPLPQQHYQPEYLYDKPSDPGSWAVQKHGLKTAFGSTDVLYLRSEVPPLSGSQSFESTVWRGERINAQILIWSPDTLSQVRVISNDLQDGKGNTISKDHFRLNIVRYVLSNYAYGSGMAVCDTGPSDSVYLMPDRLEGLDRFDLPGRSVRPVWLSIDVPQDTRPGVYETVMSVFSEKEHADLTLRIRVQDQVLPKPHDWKFRLDLWQNPWVVAWYYQVEPWSEEHKILLKKHLKLYADTGGKYITTYAVHSPWSDNSYMIEGSMIDWVLDKNGNWRFDYSIFDDYVSLAMEAGVDEAITIYTPVPWGYRFRYLDETTGNLVYEEWSPETEKFKAIWNIFLTDLRSHLEKKGWFSRTYLGINENALPVTIAAAKVIRDHSADWRITYAGDWHPELSPLLSDYSPVISSEPSLQQLGERKAKNFTTTYYVCCTPARPNNFVFSPPVESTFIAWYAAAYGYDGFLRWAYDAWPQDPVRDARHTLWPAGDCFLVYPGGNSSIRLEKLREGIVDFEKIRLLRNRARVTSDKKLRKDMSAFEDHLRSFIDHPDYSKRDYDTEKITSLVTRGRQMLEKLSDQIK